MKMRFLTLIFFNLLLLSEVLCSARGQEDEDAEMIQEHQPILTRNERSSVIVPSITSDGHDSKNAKPIVQHQRVRRPKKRKNRTKRSVDRDGATVLQNKRNNFQSRQVTQPFRSQPRGSRRFVDYNGWQPINVVDPMANEPTLVYKPPTLERVHFGRSPPNEKPLYPVRPINPSVYVVKAETPSKQLHSVYGTEQVNYLHINPESNQAKLFSSFNNDQTAKDESIRVRRKNPKVKIKVKELKTEDDESSDKIFDKNENTEVLQRENKVQKVNVGNSLSQILSTTRNPTVQPSTATDITTMSSTTEKLVETTYSPFSFDEILSSSITKTKFKIPEVVIDTPQKKMNDEKVSDIDADFSDKMVSIDGDYYIYYDYDDEELTNPRSSEELLSSGSDPFASIIPLIPKDSKKSEKDTDDEIHDPPGTVYYDSSRNKKKSALHELLQGFGGVQFDRYIFSASENNAKSLASTGSPKNFRFRQILDRKYPSSTVSSSRKVGSAAVIRDDNVNERPWYLIETRAKPKEEKRTGKKRYQNGRNTSFSNRHISRFSDSEHIPNPYLEDHLNSFKPTESLMANSLSELLQIFKFVTTPSPFNEKEGRAYVKPRTFRYTKPTEVPKHFTSERSRRFTTFRYTLSPSKIKSTTEDPTKHDVSFVDAPINNINDSVAETNSLDGYLFSDSEAAPEYTRLEVHPNIIRLTPKQKARVRFDKVTKTPPKMDEDAVRRGERDPFMVVENIKDKKNDSLDRTAFSVHEGHSRVKIFGSYGDKTKKNNMEKTIKSTDPVAEMTKQYEHLITYPPGVEVNPITARSMDEEGKIPHYIRTPFVITTTTERNPKFSLTKSFSATIPSIITKLFQTTLSSNDEPVSQTAKSTSNLKTDSTSKDYDYLNLHLHEDKSSDNIKHFYDRSDEDPKILTSSDDYYTSSGYRPNLKFSEDTDIESLSPKTTKSKEQIDFTSLPSPLEAFSRLFFSYFPSPNKSGFGTDQSEESNEYLKHLRHNEEER